MMLLLTLMDGIFSDWSIPDFITIILYPGRIKMKITKHTAPIITVIEFLKMNTPAGRISSIAYKRQTNPKFFKSLKGYLIEFEIIAPKSTKSPNTSKFILYR